MILGELKVILSAAIGDFKSRMKEAIDTVKLYGMYAKENIDKASNSFQSGFKKIGEGIQIAKDRITGALELMGKAFIALGGTIALISWQGSKYAEDLWRAWVDASGKIAAAGADLDKFGSSVINMATKSKFGLIEVANATKLAARFNLDEVKTLESVRAAMDYAMATGDDLTTSINGIARAMMVFRDKNLTGKDAANILTKANIDSRVSAEDMEMALRSLGPLANKLKWDFKDLVAMLAVFKDNNIEGGRAMMGLAAIMNDVLDPTSELGKEISKTGISIKDSSGKVKDIITLMTDLKRAGSDTSLIFNKLSAIIGPGLSNVVEKGTGALNGYIRTFSNLGDYAKTLASQFEMTLPGAFEFFVARLKDLPVVLSFFMKDSLTALFTPMQKALGDLTLMIDKSGFAKKLDIALTPVLKSIGEWISKILKNWTEFIEKLKPEDIQIAIKKIQEFFIELSTILKKAFEGIDFKALIKGLFEALVMITVLIGKFMKWFSELPIWAKNLTILTAGFIALGGPQVLAGLLSLAGGLLSIANALGIIQKLGGLALLAKLGIGGAVAAVGAIAVGGVVEGYKTAKETEKSEEYQTYKQSGGKLGPGIYNEMKNFGNAPGITGKKGEKSLGLEKVKEEINNAMKENIELSNNLDAQFEDSSNDIEVLNKQSEETSVKIKDTEKLLAELFKTHGEKAIEVTNASIEMMQRLEDEIRSLNLKYDALSRKIASIRISQTSRKQGV
jgi:TP901 family phage tail tape measure protein